MDPAKAPARLVVLISGRGRNLNAIMGAIEAGTLNATITLVVSDRVRAEGLQNARLAGLRVVSISPGHFADRASFDAALAHRIAAETPDWIVLAGFMRVLGEAFTARFAGQIINIHPSLLPGYKGLRTHERVVAAGDAEHGASVHFVTPALDDGPVIRRGRIAVAKQDTAATLAERVMAKVERRLYPAAIDDLVSGRVVWQNGRIYRDGWPQDQPPTVNYDRE